MALTDLITGNKTRLGLWPARDFKAQQPLLADVAVEFDASLREVPTHTVEVTDRPVESGASVSDHMRKLPVEIEIEGIVTDTPVQILGNARNLVGLGRGSSPMRDAYDNILQFIAKGIVLDVKSSRRTYRNMVITEFREPREAGGDSSSSMLGSLRLREFRVVKTKTTSLRTPSRPTAASIVETAPVTQSAGRAAKATATVPVSDAASVGPAAPSKSLLRTVTDLF
jgi:hypothetical protein